MTLFYKQTPSLGVKLIHTLDRESNTFSLSYMIFCVLSMVIFFTSTNSYLRILFILKYCMNWIMTIALRPFTWFLPNVLLRNLFTRVSNHKSTLKDVSTKFSSCAHNSIWKVSFQVVQTNIFYWSHCNGLNVGVINAPMSRIFKRDVDTPNFVCEFIAVFIIRCSVL